MREKKYDQERAFRERDAEIYRLHVIDGLTVSAITGKKQISSSTVYRSLATFESNNPQLAAQMKNQGKDVTPEDYKELLKEISELKKSLAQERLRADFYEEMVTFGKEVYGVDLKKVGTK